ncbi:hypothetical protein [Rhizobium sp. CECT 9324]|uniref:hypothetical protein n=1 Tax=Rhizobium sp. CECT 9324 TaxID=2845820 RepID=UPI001E3D990B|nr:hypothetical protein [Rhizobium sp. CECT 9324]CAH0343730.1 hypothetical protein RHI9324_05467 [Rhizobium sp. CECT 9324]
MTFFLYWLLTAVFVMVSLVALGLRLNRIESNFLRRLTLLVVVVVCFPAFILLALMDYFLRWMEGALGTAEAAKKFLHEIGPGFYADVRDTW